MSVSAVSPPAFTDRPFAVYWPLPVGSAAANVAFNQNGYLLGGQTVSLWNAPTGAATKNMGVWNGLYGGQFTCTAVAVSAAVMGGPVAFVPLTKNAMAASAQPPCEYTVFRWRFYMARPATANYTSLSGIGLMPQAGVNPTFAGTGGNPGIAIMGDGAGGLNFGTAKGAGFIGADTTALVWPAATSEWVMVDFEILGATGASDAAFNLYLNGVKVALPAAASKWGAGSDLPDYSITANSCGFVLGISAGDALVGQLNIAAVSCLFGRYRAQSGAQTGTLL